MKNLYSNVGKILFALTVLCTGFAEAGFSNSGKFQSRNLNLSVGGTLENNGELIGTETAKLSCETLTGKGIINSPEITIRTNIFAYTGTINCTGKCVIIASTPFNEKMFKRVGKGEFIIVYDEAQLAKGLHHTHASVHEYEFSDQLSLEIE